MTALKAPCQHGRYDECGEMEFTPKTRKLKSICPGGSLLPPDTLVIVKVDGEWPLWAQAVIQNWIADTENHTLASLLDALAAAQPGSSHDDQ